MASNTGEGNSEPLEQAEPVLHATPSRSSANYNNSARHPGNARFTVPGNEHSDSGWGPMTTSGTFDFNRVKNNRFNVRS